MKTSMKINLVIALAISFILGVLIGLHLNYKMDPNSGIKFVPVDPSTFKQILETKGTADVVAIYFQYKAMGSLIAPSPQFIHSLNELKSNQISIALGSRFFMVEYFQGPLYMTFYITTFDFKNISQSEVSRGYFYNKFVFPDVP